MIDEPLTTDTGVDVLAIHQGRHKVTGQPGHFTPRPRIPGALEDGPRPKEKTIKI